MIKLKNSQEMELMQKSGEILAEVMSELVSYVKPGITEIELDKLAEKLILQKGGEVGFNKVEGYDYTLCVSTNDQVVHGIPTNYLIKKGDLIGIDCGVFYKGFFSDMSETVLVRNEKLTEEEKKIEEFLKTGRIALEKAIEAAREGNRIGHISKTIQDIVEGAGYSVVKSLVGHGVGKSLHEEPEIPGYLFRKIDDTPLIKNGMTLAIEVIYNMGKEDVVRERGDSWTIKTKDGSLSATFEKTIAIINGKPVVLTK